MQTDQEISRTQNERQAINSHPAPASSRLIMLYMSDENTNFTSHIPNLPLQVFTVVVAVDDIGLNNNDSWSWHASPFWPSVFVFFSYFCVRYTIMIKDPLHP